MKPAKVTTPASDGIGEAEIDDVLAEFGGDVRAAIRALLADQAALIDDAQQAVSLGILRGKFSQGARRPQVDDEP